MRKGLFVVGVVLLVIGVGVAGASVWANQTPTSRHLNPGDVWQLTANSVGPMSFTMKWSAAGSGAAVYLTSVNPTLGSCGGTPSGVVANGTGDTGSMTATLTAGTTYYAFACAGGIFDGAQMSYTSLAITFLLLGAIILAVIGVVLLAVSLRAKRASTPPGMP